MKNRNLHSEPGRGSVSFRRFVMQEHSAASGHDVFQANIIGSWQALAGGVWYWRYRVTGNSWSAVYHFKVTDKALYMVSPTSQKFLASVPDDMICELSNYMKQAADRLSLSADLRTRFLKNYKNGIQKSDKIQ